MRPNRLELLNVGPFMGRTVIDFDALDDIFLITGKTGAGKTTIFDSLCYALYGALPGSRRDMLSRFRSDFAGDGEECTVTLDFTLGPKRYRVQRSPKQEKIKKRGTGTTTAEETAVLSELVQGNYISRSAKKSEADDKVKELIGLSADEFSKIVLLPQGDFADFLRQNSSERREVLQKLFPVESAVRIRELAQSKAKEVLARLEEAENALSGIADRYPGEGAEERRKLAQDSLEKARETSIRIGGRIAALKEGLRAHQAIEAAEARLGETERDLADREKGSPLWKEREGLLALSRRARPLAHLVERADQGSAAMAKAAATWETAIREEGEARSGLDSLRAQEEQYRSAEADIDGLREKRRALAEAVVLEQALSKNRSERNTLDNTLAELRKVLAAARAESQGQDRELAELEAKTGNIQDLERRYDQLRDRLDILRRAKPLAEGYSQLKKDAAISLEKQSEAVRVRDGLERRVPILREELVLLGKQKTELERGDAAAGLAADLKPGTPCPVCGSPSHPLPAAAKAPVYGLNERMEALAASAAAEEQRLAKSRAEVSAYQREAERLERARANAERTYAREIQPQAAASPGPSGSAVPAAPAAASAAPAAPAAPSATASTPRSETSAHPAALPELVDLQRDIEACSKETTDAALRKDTAVRARNRTAALYREREALAKRCSEMERKLAAGEEKRASLDLVCAQGQDRIDSLLKTWESDSLSGALARLDTRIEEESGAIRRFALQKEQAAHRASAAEATRDMALKAHQEAKGQAAAAEENLRDALGASPFPDVPALRIALLDTETEREWEEGKARHSEAIQKLLSVRAEQKRAGDIMREEQAGLKLDIDPSRLPQEIEQELTRQAAAEDGRDKAAAALAAIEREATEYQRALARRSAVEAEARSIKRLSDDLSGNNPRKRAFDAWLLGRYLEEVAAYATRRLMRMSEGRYSLLLDADRDGGRGRTGLDLAVFDAHTGKTRPCATLSGGETFMASISLALGLADSIQARSGGVRLDAVFIDEGFGSLDEASLDKALTILDEMRDHRMVGLISHVGEMRNRIPCRVDILKSNSGSRIVQGGP